MLVLTRKVGERIRIGYDVEVEVIRVVGNRVKIAIAAPLETKVLRGELCKERQADGDG
jgi:carbon storage regulator